MVKQALPQLRVRDVWLATPDRAETEVAAMELCGAITPGVVPAILDSDPAAHALVMELIPPSARNWQAEVGEGRVHSEVGLWAGATLGAWHATTSLGPLPAGFDDLEAFEQLRLRPFHETVVERRPELADGITPLLEELRSDRHCFVHGDYSLKNMLVGPEGNWVLDFEVAHYGNPVFDLGFFLSFVVLSAIRWEPLTRELRVLAAGFLDGYHEIAGVDFAGDRASVTAHTAALMLARTDGKSPAQFLDPPVTGACARGRDHAPPAARGRPLAVALITGLHAWEALDSRGTPTVGCAVTLEGGSEGEATVPSGASTGSHEAHERRDGGERYGGKGVRDAVSALRGEIRAELVGRDATDQDAIDAALRALDGTPDLSRLGANAVLAASVACAVAAARSEGLPLWKALCPELPPLLPLPMVNVISGGAHAGGLIDVQDFLVVPVGARTFAEAIEWASRVRAATAAVMRERGHDISLVADEGGLAAPLPSNRAALEVLLEGIERSGLEPGVDAAIAIDVAATQLLVDGTYVLASEGRSLRAVELVAELESWTAHYPIVSIEDPLGEDDHEGWRHATERLAPSVQVLGDDLFVTSPERLRVGIEDRIANAVLVKPNQVGTLSDARQVVEIASDGRLCHGALRPLGRDRGQLARRSRRRLAHGTAEGRLDDPLRTHREVEPAAAHRVRGAPRDVCGSGSSGTPHRPPTLVAPCIRAA